MGAGDGESKEMGSIPPAGASSERPHEPDSVTLFGQTFRRSAAVPCVVSFYWIVSLALVFLNKAVMRSDFPFPLFITWVQIVIALLLLVFLDYLRRNGHASALSFIPDVRRFDTDKAREILPLTLVYVAWISLTNVCLKYVEVSFYQLVKSLNIVMNIALQWRILGQPSSAQVVVTCVVIMLGFMVGSVGEIRFSWAGLVAGVLSSGMQSVYGVLVKKKLKVVNDDSWQLLYYNTILSAALLLPVCVAVGEISVVVKTPELYDIAAWTPLALTGIFGFLINIAIFMQIKVTTALTATVSGTAKACVQTFLSVLIFGNPISALNFAGLCLSLAGSGAYSYVKYVENEAKKLAAGV